ncbi:MAG: ABC transporter permease [Candidatus Freyarchaeota archaeon]|nr:ABC transporter permease [Candidatus Freyrarchaeum guaymaensis]
MLKEAWYICERELKHFTRMRVQIISSIATPVIWLVFFGYSMSMMPLGFGGLGAIIGGERNVMVQLFIASLNLPQPLGLILSNRLEISYLDFFYSGVIAVTVMFASIFNGLSVIWDKRFGFLNKLLVAPIPRLSIMLGKTLFAMIRATLQGVIILSLSFLIGAKVYTGALGVALAILFMMLFSLGFGALSTSLGLKLADQEALFGIINMITLPLFLASGAFMPIEFMPSWLQVFAYGNPLTYAVDALRTSLLGGPYSAFGPPFSLINIAPKLMKDLAVLSAFTLFFLSFGTLIFRKSLT